MSKSKATKAALDAFKMEAANEVGVNLKNGYNGDITARQAGSVGGQMVNIMTPVRTLVFARKSRLTPDRKRKIFYHFYISFS